MPTARDRSRTYVRESASTTGWPSAIIDGVGDEAVSAYDTCLAELDKLEGMIRRGIIVPGEYELKVQHTLATYFEDEGVADDVEFLVAYARNRSHGGPTIPFMGTGKRPIASRSSFAVTFTFLQHERASVRSSSRFGLL